MITAKEAKDLSESYVDLDEVYEFIKDIEIFVRESCAQGSKYSEVKIEKERFNEKTFKEVKRRLKQLGFSYSQTHYQISDDKNYNFTITWEK